ncbi:MAG: NADP-dependent oxidoreductase [bacterium]|nr:NADP-dependent oxidoreductase [bacterium]
MKAAQITQFGGPEVIEIVEIEKPKPLPGQVLVKVYASSINPIDYKVRQGMIPSMKFPFTLGSDIAGVVTEIGEGVEGFAVGNKVYGQAISLAGASGAFAEFAAVSAKNIAKMPDAIDFNEAAAMVLAGVSAVQALTEHIKLVAGQRILIHGGAGGIGSITIQIAKHLGAHVATTATGSGIEFVKKLGADEVIDYKVQKFEELLSGYDAVFDTIGGEVYEKSFKVLKKNGIIISMVAADEKKLASQYGVTAIIQSTKVNSENLNKLAELIEKKVVRPHIDKIYPIDNIKEAFQEAEAGQVLGKIVITISH